MPSCAPPIWGMGRAPARDRRGPGTLPVWITAAWKPKQQLFNPHPHHRPAPSSNAEEGADEARSLQSGGSQGKQSRLVKLRSTTTAWIPGLNHKAGITGLQSTD